jgi:ribosomal protein S18 acetylase RimI-like enzyme
MVKTDLNEVVMIHGRAFPDFFLTSLGKRFLYELYKNFVLNKYSICKVAKKGKIIQGFAIGSMNPVLLFRKMLFKKGFLLLLFASKALINNPKVVFIKLFYALKYRGEAPPGFSNPTLLSSIGVDPECETKGIGSLLVESFCNEAYSKGADVVYLTTDKYLNDRVNSFYLKNGFQLEAVIEKPDGREMNRYIKLPDETNS